MFTKVEDNEDYTLGTSLAGYLEGVLYIDLVKAFGEPTHSDPSEDDKVQKEWIFVDNKSQSKFTIYDWKTYDSVYTMNRYNRWHVGSKGPADKFIAWCLKKLKK